MPSKQTDDYSTCLLNNKIRVSEAVMGSQDSIDSQGNSSGRDVVKKCENEGELLVRTAKETYSASHPTYPPQLFQYTLSFHRRGSKSHNPE